MNRIAIPNSRGKLLIYSPLAQEIGFNEHLVLLQLEYLQSISTTEKHFGRDWTYQSIRDLQQNFPFWGKSTIHRVIQYLKKMKLIRLGSFNAKKYDRTIWYSIEWEEIAKLKSIGIMEDLSQNGTRSSQIGTRKSQNGTRKSQIGTTIPYISTSTSPSISAEEEVFDFDKWELEQLAKEAK